MKKKIKYTDSASAKISSVLINLKERIEEDIRDSKNYPGEDFIEITASDIEDTYQRINLRSKQSKNYLRNRMVKQILPIYFVLGILMTIYGLLYDQITELITTNSSKLYIIFAGFLFSLITAAMYALLKQKEIDRRKDIISSRMEVESELREDRKRYEMLINELTIRNTERSKLINKTIHSDHRKFEEAIKLLNEMREEGISPNVLTFNALIKSSYNFEAAMKVYQEMRQEALTPNQSTYNLLIYKSPNFEKGRMLLNEMREEGINPNEITFNALIQKATDFEQAKLILAEMKQAGVNPDELTYNSLINKLETM